MRHRKTTPWLALLAMALLALPAAAQVDDHNKIKYPKLPDFKIPAPEVFTLDNGMTVYLMEDPELPLINVRARARTGSNYEPAEKAGLASILGQVQREGGIQRPDGSAMTGDEIDDFLAARAAFIETGIGGESGSASMNCLKDDFDTVFALFHDILRYPAVAEDKIELAKVQENTGIARRNDNIAGIAGREFSRLIYGPDSALSRMTEYATVAAVTRNDLIAWHGKYYHPNNIQLGVVGDFDSAAMKQKISSVFGGWPKGPAFNEGEVEFALSKPGVYFIEKEDVTQAYVRWGHLGIETKNPDYFAVQVMNEALGGSFASRLFSNVRSEKGLAYNVFGRVGSSFMRPGVFLVGLSTKSETMAASVDALREEVEGIINNPPDAKEMTKAKESILNSFVFNYASMDQILGQQMLYAYYGMPADFLETYREKIEAVTREDVARVAKKYIHPDQMVLLIVGKAEDFDRPASTFGEVTELDLTIPPPPDTRPEVVKSASNIKAGAKLFAKASKTLAGAAAAPLNAARISYTTALSMGGQQMSVGQDVSFILPNKMRTILKTPMGEQVIVLNEDKGYQGFGGQNQPLPGDSVEEGLKQLGRELLVLAGNAGHPEVEAVAAGTENVNGTECQVVAVTFMGMESRLYVDADGKVVKQAYQGKHPLQGTPGLIEIIFSDYSDVDGRLVAHKRVMSFEGQEVATSTLDSIQINPELDVALFEVPN